MGIGHKIIRIAHQNIPHAPPPPPTTSLCRCTYITWENESKLFVSKAELANTSQIKIYIKKVSGFFFILKTFTQLSKNFEYKHFKAYLVVHTYNYVNKLNGPPCK